MSVCLMLHGLGPPPSHVSDVDAQYWLPLKTFALVVSLARPANATITFDDGNASDTEIALPALLHAGLKASFFIPSDRVGTPGYVNATGLRMLHESGMLIGSHGCAHVRWNEMPDSAIVEDVRRSVENLSSIIGENVTAVAVPFGACDRRVLDVLRNLGIGRVYTSFSGPDSGRGWLVRRDCITADLTEAEVRDLIVPKSYLPRRVLSLLRAWHRAGSAALRPA
jgi:peptidoglycan/xylan/chitin deacetylase (PgdA/CDA1 family)